MDLRLTKSSYMQKIYDIFYIMEQLNYKGDMDDNEFVIYISFYAIKINYYFSLSIWINQCY